MVVITELNSKDDSIIRTYKFHYPQALHDDFSDDVSFIVGYGLPDAAECTSYLEGLYSCVSITMETDVSEDIVNLNEDIFRIVETLKYNHYFLPLKQLFMKQMAQRFILRY